MIKKGFVIAALALLSPTIASAATYIENFNEVPFTKWSTNWLGVNSNLTNYYGSGQNGLSGGIYLGENTVDFTSSFGANLKSFSIHLLSFRPGTSIEIFDSNGNALLTEAISVPYSWGAYLGNNTTYSVTSSTGIGGFTVSGANAVPNTFIESVVVKTAVPEPSTWAMMLLGFAGVGFARYRQTMRKDGVAFTAA